MDKDTFAIVIGLTALAVAGYTAKLQYNANKAQNFSVKVFN